MGCLQSDSHGKVLNETSGKFYSELDVAKIIMQRGFYSSCGIGIISNLKCFYM